MILRMSVGLLKGKYSGKSKRAKEGSKIEKHLAKKRKTNERIEFPLFFLFTIER